MPQLDSSRSKGALIAVLSALTLLFFPGGCDKRTAEEKGRDFANRRVGFAQGAAGVLEEKGKGLGTSVGKGVGELVKGAGAAVKDVVYAPVKVTLAAELAASGLKLLQAHEGEVGGPARTVALTIEFPKAYEGRLQLRAFAGDDESKEVGRSAPTKNVTQAGGSMLSISLAFPADTRLSKIGHYLLTGLAPKTASLAPGLEASAIAPSQLSEDPTRATLYLVFNKPYRGGLQLRAYAADGGELGRSEATTRLSQERDSAMHMSFDFDEKTPLGDVSRYVLFRAEPRAVPKPK
jgi:hypothetical protein